MPSALHQAIVEALREKPALVRELGRRVERRIPAGGRLEVKDSKLADVSPPDYSADLVVMVADGDGAGGVPAVTEVELARRRPELAMLSAIFHHDNEAVARGAVGLN